jgi:hypothetical protein
MRDVTFRVDGLNKLLRALEKLDEAAKQEFREAGKEAGKIVATEAKVQVPVLTGRLQRTIKASSTTRGAKVMAGRATVPYAPIIHFGWPAHNIAPNRFLYRAVDNKVKSVVDAYLATIYNIWNRNV